MIAKVPKRTLSEALALLERVIPSRHSNPILTHLHLSTEGPDLCLLGSNLEIDLALLAPAELQDEGTALIPAHLFAQIVRGLPGEIVQLTQTMGELHVESGNFKTRLTTVDTADYPEPRFTKNGGLQVGAGAFAKALGRVRYAASNEEYRAVFRGVQLELSPERLRAVASDGFRLARYDQPVQSTEVHTIVIPARSVDEIIRVLKDESGEVELGFIENSLVLYSPRFRMRVSLMEGSFPDYERVIPTDCALEVHLDAEVLRTSLRRVSMLADKSNHRVDLLFQENRLEVVSEGDYGQGREELHTEHQGEPQKMLAYNAQYLIDALSQIEGMAHLKMAQAGPTIIEAADDQGYLAVVVPLRV